MHAIKSHPETHRCSSADQVVPRAPRSDASSHADIALVAAILVPPVIVGLLLLIGIGIGLAVCIMFASVFAAATTLDVRWLLRCRRANNDRRRAQE